ncbi:AsmA-like C-terminal region-containing protein [Roseimicrobium gellanilyticum]|nr:AsmA-like C-terminal region-containing protein [Roseimicrobium gellanilyticum]
MNEKAGADPRPRRRRWPWVLLVLVLLLCGGLWGAYEWATAKAVATLNSRLAERSLYLSYTSGSWVPWKGLGLENMVLYQDEARTKPLIALSNLDVELPWQEMAAHHEFISRWKLSDATLELHDPKGKVTLEHVSMEAVVRDGVIEYSRLDLKNGPRLFSFSGAIHLGSDKEKEESPKEFVMDLDPMRSILDALDFKEDAGVFHISGKVSFDARETPMTWSADLIGEGEHVIWQGVPMHKAVMKAAMSQSGFTGTCSIAFAKGGTDLDLDLKDWRDAPMSFSGKITDSEGRINQCKGTYRGKDDVVVVEEMQGKANMLEFLGNFPAMNAQLPKEVQVRAYPDMVMKNLVWKTKEGTWTMSSLHLRSPLELSVKVEGHSLPVDQVKGEVAYTGTAWKFSDISAKVLGGTLSLQGMHDGKVLRDATVSVQNVRMADLGPWLGENGSSFGKALASLSYKGDFAVEPEHLTGSGSIQIENSPTVHVPLLDETYALFAALIPGLKRESGNGEMSGQFTSKQGVLTFSSFKANGGSVTVTGSGTVDLVRRTVAATAQGRLRGVGGVVTAPISRLMEMEVSGPLDDIRVRPAGDGLVGNVVDGTVDVARGTIKGATKVTGSVVKEGVKIPFRALNLFRKKK